MKKRMCLQLFEDGGGAGSGGQGGNAGDGNGVLREMPVDQETRGHTVMRRQKRLPMQGQKEPKRRRSVLIFSNRE